MMSNGKYKEQEHQTARGSSSCPPLHLHALHLQRGEKMRSDYTMQDLAGLTHEMNGKYHEMNGQISPAFCTKLQILLAYLRALS